MVNENEQTVPSVSFITLGCAKNLVDTEKMLGLLAEAGLYLVDTDDENDAIIINTCGFIEDARQEAYENIEYALEQKANSKTQAVIVTGCLAKYKSDELVEKYPELDGIIGLAERNDIAKLVYEILGRTQPEMNEGAVIRCDEFDRQTFSDQARLRITNESWSYLRISEGCDRRCTFCSIPTIRGSYRSRPIEEILEEAKELAADGVLELNLIAQETSSYGSDIGYDEGLGGLLKELNAIEGLRWIRILYVHPATLRKDTIDAMAECEKVVPYLDIPLQHINDRILKKMHRSIDREKTVELIEYLREIIPDITLRTTMLVGFPSETDEEFNELIEFVKDVKFDRLGGFFYSPEEGTPAERMDDRITIELGKERLNQLMCAQQDIAFEHGRRYLGKMVECLITEELSLEEIEDLDLDVACRWFVGRHAGQAPETDGECYLAWDKDNESEPDYLHKAVITESKDYDLIGELIDNAS